MKIDFVDFHFRFADQPQFAPAPPVPPPVNPFPLTSWLPYGAMGGLPIPPGLPGLPPPPPPFAMVGFRYFDNTYSIFFLILANATTTNGTNRSSTICKFDFLFYKTSKYYFVCFLFSDHLHLLHPLRLHHLHHHQCNEHFSLSLFFHSLMKSMYSVMMMLFLLLFFFHVLNKTQTNDLYSSLS